MKISLKRLALGTTALALILSQAAWAEDPEDTPAEEEGSIIDDLIKAAPLRPGALAVEGDEGSVPNDLGVNEGLGSANQLDPAGILGLAANEASVGRYLGDFGIPKAFNTKLRVNYDSNICENYNSGSLFLPNNSNYETRLVDDAMADINRLSDNQFLDFMDWLDGAKPPLLVLRDSPLGRAMDTVDWLNDAEIDEVFRQTAERDADLYLNGPSRLRLSFNGVFAQALTPKTPAIETPRYISPRYGGYTFEAPKVSINQDLTEADLEAIKNFVNGTGGGLIQSETPGKIDAFLPYNRVYGLDRFQIRADYNYGLDNGITDGSVPTIGPVITPGSIPGLSVAIDGYNIDISSILKPPTELPYNPSEYRFHLMNRFDGGMTQIDPPTLDLDARDDDPPPDMDFSPPAISAPEGKFELFMTETPTSTFDQDATDVPIESVIPELSDPFRIEGHIGKDNTEAIDTIETFKPSLNLSYDLSGGYSLNFPLGKYDQSTTTTETPATTTTTEQTPQENIYNSSIQFKIEESVFENNQINTNPAQEVVVKLGFPIPPLPLEGNPRIDEGASDDPLQGEVDSAGNFNLKYDYKDNFGIGIRAEYDYSGLDDTEVGDGSPPTLTLVEPETATGEGSDQGWSIDPNLIRLRMDFGGGMTQIDPPTLDLSAGPSNEPIESVIPELTPYTGQIYDEPTNTTPDTTPATDQTPGDSTLQGRQTDINWNDVQQALGEFADIPAIDRMRDRDGQHEGWEPSTSAESGDTSTGADVTPFSWDQISPRIGLNYDIGTPNPVIIRSGIRGTSSDVDLDINMQPIGSKILYRTDPNASLGGLEDFSLRSFGIGNYTLDPIFYPLANESEIDALIRDIPGIVRAEPNPYRDKQGDDPYFKSEGTWGQDYADQWAIQHIGFTAEDASAWAAAGSELEEVIVAVIDTGIDWNHADISWDSIWRNYSELPDNGIDDDGNGYIDDLVGWDFFLYNNLPWDEDGHGTFVTGIIAAISDNNTGISGINPAAKIMVIKALDSFGHTRASYLAEAIAYAVNNGAQIINLSVGGEGLSHAEEIAVQYAEENGVLVFAAAGNKGSEASNFGFVPYETVVTVGSTTRGDAKSNFSNWGEGIDIMAPGEDILSLRARRTDLMLNVRHLTYEMGTAYVGDDRRYYRAAGTSFSAPIVAGIASLILSKNPDLTPAEVRRMLYQSALDIDVPGRDQQTGYGLVDAKAAINADPAFEIIADIEGVQVVQEKGRVFVNVNGTVSANAFGQAEISIGQGENPETWKVVGDRVKKPVAGGLLGQIPAAEFQSAPVWIIRVVVTHKNGKTREERFRLSLG